MEMILVFVGGLVAVLCIMAIVMGFIYFDEWEIGIELIPKGYNNFELGFSNRNHTLVEDEGQEQELRIGFLLFTVFFLFRRFDA